MVTPSPAPPHQGAALQKVVCTPAWPPHTPAPSPGLAVVLLSISCLLSVGKMSFGPKSYCWRSEKAAWSGFTLHGGGLLQRSWLWHLTGRCLLRATDHQPGESKAKLFIINAIIWHFVCPCLGLCFCMSRMGCRKSCKVARAVLELASTPHLVSKA